MAAQAYTETPMASLPVPATHLLSLFPTISPETTRHGARFLFQSHKPNPRTSCSFSFANRAPPCPISKPGLSRAIPNYSSVPIEANPKRDAATIREICEGHVPEHVIRRSNTDTLLECVVLSIAIQFIKFINLCI
jgi:hypothetical protein